MEQQPITPLDYGVQPRRKKAWPLLTGVLLLFVTGFCVFGFLLSFEPGADPYHLFKVVYAMIGDMKNLPLSKVYQLLEPGPVVLLTTASKGRANVMTMSWQTMVEFEPPLIACVVSSADYSFAALRATRECVIAIPAVKLARKVVQVGNSSGRDIDKFEAFGLTTVPAQRVTPPLIAECFANLECRVSDSRFVNKYNLFILEVLKAWTDPTQRNPKTIHHRGCGTFVVDGKIIKLKSKMR